MFENEKVTAYVQVKMKCVDLKEHQIFRAELNALPQILECYRVIGDYEYILKVAESDLACMSDFLAREISYSPYVREFHSLMCIDNVISSHRKSLLQK